MEKSIEIRVNASSKEMGDKIIAEIGKLNGKPLNQKVVIGPKKLGRYTAYIDEVSEDNTNLIGMVASIDGKTVNAEIEDEINVLDENVYEIKLDASSNNTISGKIVFLSNVAEQGITTEKNGEIIVPPELQAIIDEKINEGIVTKEEMDERLKVFNDNYILKDTCLMTRILKGYRKYEKPCKSPKTIYVDPYPEKFMKNHEEGILAEGLRAACSRHAMICEGEKSVGKNVYLDTIAWLMGMPSRLITFSRNMAPSSIYGEKTTDNSPMQALHSEQAMEGALAKQRLDLRAYNNKEEATADLQIAANFELLKAQSAAVNIVIDSSELYDWLTDGGLLIFNEMNMAESNFFASFTNQLLDGTGYLFIPGRGEVSINKDCVLFGTQNADYEGVEEQNEATMSRFGCLYFEQPKSIKRQLMVATKSAIRDDGFDPDTIVLNDEYYKQAESFYTLCRNAVMGKMGVGMVSNAVLNIRGFVRALAETAESNGFTKLKRQIENHVINTCPTGEREALKSILSQSVSL